MLTQPELKKEAHKFASEAIYVNLGGMQELNDNYI